MSVWAPPGDLPKNTTQACTDADATWLAGLAIQGGMAHLLHTRRVLALGTVFSFLLRLRRAYRCKHIDLVHANWLQNALPLWGTSTPALITVLGSDFGLLRVPGMRLLMRAMLRQRRAILAPNAEWMTPTLRQMFGDLVEVRTVPFGVDNPWFEVVRVPARDNVRHWLAVTRLTHAKLGDLFTWGEGLFGPTRQLHLFGPMQEPVDVPPWVCYHGPTHPAELMQKWFPIATGLITLSQHDEGRPQVLLEAMASGLPVLASDLPAHRDMLQHQQTGWLAASRLEVEQGLNWLEQPRINQQLGESARQWIKASVGTWDDCANRYAQAYLDLLGS
ncbi:MAG: glycosyltransferase family 4 protein [Burkholderiaceae bacterium]|nr:glycosyltransferase family 4 protein [Burkholderiaceae bacterium]